jgi:hypothetical protein
MRFARPRLNTCDNSYNTASLILTARFCLMAMKKTDLEKNKALKLTHSMKQTRSERFGKATTDMPLDRREQRKLDQAQGLVPFACKLNSELVDELKARAATHAGGMTGLLDELLRRGLAAGDADV